VLRVCSVELLEDGLLLGRRDPDALVGDLDPHAHCGRHRATTTSPPSGEYEGVVDQVDSTCSIRSRSPIASAAPFPRH
jgi:hypothetical protein